MKVVLVLVGSDILNELAIKVDSINASVISGCIKELRGRPTTP